LGKPRKVLLTGATGFVGHYALPALLAAGHEVRCTGRAPERPRALQPGCEWRPLDVHAPETFGSALAGCDAALYLVHGMREGGGYAEREVCAASAFHAAARAAGVPRIVYLGAVEPAGEPSPHLRSRLQVGEALRQPGCSTVELRAGLIIGHGGESWLMVRDLARRLPMMVLPRWLRNRAQPVFIDDVIAALLAALALESEASVCLDVPGPEVVTHRELLERTSAAFSRRPPMIDVPVLTPRLSCYWITLFTRANRQMARELVEGLTSDLLASDEGIFARVAHLERTPLDVAIRTALEDERHPAYPSTDAIARLERLGKRALA
jgi:uncharacterized protein YbjT (DUF2867 family)